MSKLLTLFNVIIHVTLGVKHIFLLVIDHNASYPPSSMHPEKCFVESIKVYLAQQSFSFKYGSIETLFELTTEILMIFLQFQQKNFASSAQK